MSRDRLIPTAKIRALEEVLHKNFVRLARIEVIKLLHRADVDTVSAVVERLISRGSEINFERVTDEVSNLNRRFMETLRTRGHQTGGG